jgi:hypothetical protein
MDPTNNIAWTRKGFTGSVRSHVGWVWGKTWVEISDGALSFVRTNIVATISSRDITNRNQPLLFLHMDPSNNIAWTYGRVSPALWHHAGWVWGKTWVENNRWL